jgi:lysophospholipase L1-like esterase
MKILLLTFLILSCLVAVTTSRAQEPARLAVVQTRGGLPNVFAKLRAGKPVSIVYFGGSITAGAGASKSDETSYRGRVGHWFETTFPNSKITNVNAAIGGTGSDLGAFRIGRDVLAHKPDLVFVEYAVNDGGQQPEMIDRAMEGIVRQIRRANAATDICFVYTFVVGQLNDFKAGRLPRAIQRDEVVAERYALPAVNVALPAARKLLDGSLTNEQFSKDGVHPTDAGYQIYTDAIVSFLDTQKQNAARARRSKLPQPLRMDSLEHTRMLGPDAMLAVGPEWQIVDKSPTGDFAKLLVSDKPGAETTIAFAGPILAMFYVLGPDTGAFDYRIDDGNWQTLDPFDVFAKGYYRSSYRLLADGLPNTRHNITFKIRAEHNPDSKGTWTRLGFLLTNSSP